ncbi:ORC-CDC6 family AAA ATPase [Acinetobacter venetianus]|uniref:ORC-CDC6 family AAA ATPase n=1 Tax=Acinetobacter venetianus TaxID=52133 RepID=UPI00384B7944
MENSNPFSFSKASDYTDEEINTFWVDIDDDFVRKIIDPTSKKSSFILGGKGTGKTHLLRHFSYASTKLRYPNLSGLDMIQKDGFLGVFLRANALDASRFDTNNHDEKEKWQKLFAIFLELKLTENLLDILIDIEKTSVNYEFNTIALIDILSCEISQETSFSNINSLEGLKLWLKKESKKINTEINNYAFTNTLELIPPFSPGSLSLKFKKALDEWHPIFQKLSLVYLIDEVENFYSIEHQEVIQSFIRYGEGMTTFRISGRLYAIKTYSTIGGGEENREDVEFKKINLDEKLKELGVKYKVFANNFIKQRLYVKNLIPQNKLENFNIEECFENIKSTNFYSEFIDFLELDPNQTQNFVQNFRNTLLRVPKLIAINEVDNIIDLLTSNFPILLQKHNILRFCKDYRNNDSAMSVANNINQMCNTYLENPKDERCKSYDDSYSHWSLNLIAQLCRENRKPVIYAGFDTFVKMSSNNPRNLLGILSNAYDLAIFNNLDFINKSPLSVQNQTKSVLSNSKFIFEQDSNYGRPSDIAQIVVDRLASLLRTARFALNIPEVSPLTVSFIDDDLSKNARLAIQSALNYSFIFETSTGRPDRNSERINRKIYLNPILSPKWDLPIGRRGDLSLSTELVNAIFDIDKSIEFKVLLMRLDTKWNNPFTRDELLLNQPDLFSDD